MKTLAKLVAVPATIFATGCNFGFMDSSLDKMCNPWIDTFFRDSVGRQAAAFNSYDLESQYTIFICGNQVIHPPAIELADPLAKHGAAIVPLLKKKLAHTNDDLTIRDIVLVFREMQQQGSYNVSSDTSLMRLVTQKVDSMHSGWKDIVQGNVNKIRGVSK